MLYKSTKLVDGKFEDDPKEQINQALLDLLKKVNELPDVLIPIGSKYTQYPDDPEPKKRYPWATWEEVSKEYAGCFFRVAGGKALVFKGGKQAGALWAHKHQSLAGGGGGAQQRWLNDGTGSGNIAFINTLSQVGDAIDDGVHGTPNLADETRPDNYTIRIWKRTA